MRCEEASSRNAFAVSFLVEGGQFVRASVTTLQATFAGVVVDMESSFAHQHGGIFGQDLPMHGREPFVPRIGDHVLHHEPTKAMTLQM